MAKRKSLSKKIRFEIFKRDLFTCQYCGSKAPDVILNVDHINPVSRGGENNIENLITSCWECNSGKKAIKLSDSAVIEKSRSQIEESQEKLEQIRMMSDWAIGMAKGVNAEFDAVNDLFKEISEFYFEDKYRSKISNLCKKYGLKVVLEALPKALEYREAKFIRIKDIKNACELLIMPESLSNAKYCRGIYKNRFGTKREFFDIIEERAESLIGDFGYDVVLKWFKNDEQDELRKLMGLEVPK